ncbi:MAG: thioredoxin domain-containing protein [Phycisphaerales bacterium]|nr:thioredoxin domain-containing protein [Phycisphaerales bacterium]
MPVSRAAWWLGLVLLLAAAAASGMLVLQHLGSLELPGCGFRSDCARAANSAWGKVPILAWPTSHLGLAYFLALSAAWIAGRGAAPRWLRILAVLGAFASVVLVLAMVFGGYFCRYCLAVHVANLLFAGVLVATPARPARSRGTGVAFAAIAVGSTMALALVESSTAERRTKVSEAELKRSIADMVAPPAAPDGATENAGAPSDPPNAVVEAPSAPPAPPFTGRYRIGPEAAPIRIVIISDYQCPDCRLIETQAQAILAERTDVSLSAKQFPFCTDCNSAARAANMNPHPNACWAARAAETAGILGGNDGFWRMHHWLFQRRGAFTDAEIRAGLVQLGFDVEPFLRTMQSEETLARVQADVQEAVELGLWQTPMIFINGVELLGWMAPDALRRAVEQVAATHPPPRTAVADHPPPAFEKRVRDWREQPVRSLPADLTPNAIGAGPTGSPESRESRVAEVVVWGDYEEPYTAELDRRVRAVVEQTEDVRYTFRHYPVNRSCNPSAARTLHDDACAAAQAAEAAGALGGNDAYWRLHDWMMAHQDTLDATSLAAAAAELGFDAEAFAAAMSSPQVAEAIRADGAAAKSLGLRSIPFVFVNGKFVPFWRKDNEPLIERIIDEARTGRAGTTREPAGG